MKRWGYEWIEVKTKSDFKRELNSLGLQGWKCVKVFVTHGRYEALMEREVPEPKLEPKKSDQPGERAWEQGW